MQRADQAHGKGNGNAKTAQNHAAAGVVHGRERVHHRNTHARARTIAQIDAALCVSITIRRFT